MVEGCLVSCGEGCGELFVDHGVPQGFVLGPVLFLLLVSDFRGLDEALLYADDTTLMTGGATVGEVVKLKEQHWKTLQLRSDGLGATIFC